jgi:hypothetical protein
MRAFEGYDNLTWRTNLFLLSFVWAERDIRSKLRNGSSMVTC